MEPECLPTDTDIALGMAMRDESSLRIFAERYGGRLKAYLVKYFYAVLQAGELEEALNTAIFNVWRFADRYDEREGSLGGWAVRIAQRAAQSILRRETRYRAKTLEYDPAYDPAAAPAEDGDEQTGLSAEQLENLEKAIAQLPPLQQAIIRADLAAGGPADAGRLAIMHNTDKNSIYVSRSKAKHALKNTLGRMARSADRTRMRT